MTEQVTIDIDPSIGFRDIASEQTIQVAHIIGRHAVPYSGTELTQGESPEMVTEVIEVSRERFYLPA